MRRCGAIGLVVALAAGGCCWTTTPRERSSRRDEGVALAGELARGVAACAERDRGKLPPTARTVPSQLADVAGKAWSSKAEDWTDEAYKCAHFGVGKPQRWQLQWVVTGARQGLARATADFDGDSRPDYIVEHDVSCSGEKCLAAPYVREPEPPTGRDGGAD